MTINVTVTGKWTHGTGQDDTNDPAPPSVMVIETVYLDQDGVNGDGTLATGAFDDAFGDQSYVVSSYRGLDQVCTTPSGIPIQHQSIEPGSPFTIARTFKVSSTAAAYQQNGCNAVAHFDGYTATIHAQPYNFQRTNFSDETPPTSVVASYGQLAFHYSWSSTSGVLGGLLGETIHENVVAPSSPSTTVNGKQFYSTDTPPFLWDPPVLLDVSTPATIGNTQDNNTYGANINSTLAQCFAKSYKVDHFDLTQTLLFNDPAVMAPGAEQAIPGNSGPFTITDAVIADPTSPSGYSFTVTKDGSTSLPVNLP